MITKDIALTLSHRTILNHKTLKNSDGTAVRCRVNGACKTWKTDPTTFRLPVKHGLKEYFYITPSNANDWICSV